LTTGPTNSVRHFEVSKFYLACSQCHELKQDYKESNHKRMDCFDCHGKLIIGIDIEAKKAKNLHIDPVQLRTQFIKTRGQFELYGIISSTHGARFPIAYLMLNTIDASDNAQMGLRTKSLTVKLQNEVVTLIKKHFNMHQKILANAVRLFLTAEEIHIAAVREMYDFCFENYLVLLWAYLWSKWYKITRWTLWAQSAQTTIPISKTIMLIESHWRRDWSQLATTPIDNNNHTQVNTQKSIISIASHESDNNLIEIDKDDEALSSRLGNTLAKMDEKQKVEAVRRIADHFEHELAANNFNYVICVINKMDKLFTMLNDIETVQNRRRHNPTWQGSTP
ncbi:7425_t:CDS:2, partial [Gigaspora rosea]